MMENPLVAVVLLRTPLNYGTKGINGTYKATVRGIDGDSSAIAKAIPADEIGVECLCALLGRSVGLPIPRPMVLLDEEFGLMYGSEEMPHPDLKHAGFPSAVLSELLCKWEQLPGASAFDEWIANPDRHGGNMLTDGIGGFWLIDHGLSMAANLTESQRVSNGLLELSCELANDDLKKHRLIRAFDKFIREISDENVRNYQNEGGFVADRMLDFLIARKLVLFTLLRKQVLNHEEIPGF